jgi:hypothetical protein
MRSQVCESVAVRWIAGSLMWLTGCSALIDVSGVQCSTNDECIARELGNRCVDNVCVTTTPAACQGSGCNNVPDAGDSAVNTCTIDAQCTRKNAPRCMRGTCVAEDVAQRWVCAPQDPPPDAASDTIHYSFRVLEFVSRAAPKNLRALACRSNDVSCGSPVASFEDTHNTGLVELDIPRGFLGFFEVRSDALTAYSYVSKPLREDIMDRDLQVSAQSTVDLLASVDGTEFDMSKGILLAEAFDCSGTPAGGIHFSESKATSRPFYIVNHVPNSDATVSVYDAENNVADGGFINVQPGFVSVTAALGVDGPKLGEFNAHVAAGAITYIDMYF